MTDCCETRCINGQNCPVRSVRAGGPPPDDLPVQFVGDEPIEPPVNQEPKPDSDNSLAWYVAVVVLCGLAVFLWSY